MRDFKLFFVILLAAIVGCDEPVQSGEVNQMETTVAVAIVPNVEVQLDSLEYDNRISSWKLNDKAFSGFAVAFYDDGTRKERFGIVDGKKENQAFQWFPNRQLKLAASYHKGMLHGEKKVWSQDSGYVMISHLNYQLGKAHGEQVLWYNTGELYKKMNLYKGKEDGLQQAFRKNGALYSNYEAKNGRIFGLKKTALCFGLEDETIRNEDK